MRGKIIMATTLSCCLLFGQSLFAERINNVRDLDTNNNGIYEPHEVNPCATYQTGPSQCYSTVTRFREKKYCVKRCIEEPYTVKKKCCRYVPQYYTKQYCKYVPQYYTKTFCRQVPEYYCVDETRYRKRYVTDEKCCYEPYTCVEKRCVDIPTAACPSCPPVQEECPCAVDQRYAQPRGHVEPAPAPENGSNGMNHKNNQNQYKNSNSR